MHLGGAIINPGNEKEPKEVPGRWSGNMLFQL